MIATNEPVLTTKTSTIESSPTTIKIPEGKTAVNHEPKESESIELQYTGCPQKNALHPILRCSDFNWGTRCKLLYQTKRPSFSLYCLKFNLGMYLD